jgi:AcrR family transcriptional regulator
MPSRPSTHSVSSRERLLRAAKQLFAAHGYEQTATSAIARAAGTSESQLMRYFGGKIGLLEALFEAAWIDLNRRTERLAERDEPVRLVLLNIIDAVTTALARDPDQAVLFLFEARRLRGGAARVRLSAGFTAFNERLKALVKRGVTRKELNPSLDPAAVTAAVLGALEGMLRERLLARARRARAFGEGEIRRTLEAMLSGLEPPARPGRRP